MRLGRRTQERVTGKLASRVCHARTTAHQYAQIWAGSTPAADEGGRAWKRMASTESRAIP